MSADTGALALYAVLELERQGGRLSDKTREAVQTELDEHLSGSVVVVDDDERQGDDAKGDDAGSKSAGATKGATNRETKR